MKPEHYIRFVFKTIVNTTKTGILPLSQEINGIDHLGFRCETDEEYADKCRELLQYGHNALEEPVNGRLVSIFGLHRPLEFSDHLIPFYEAIAPKEGSYYSSGLEHVDFIVNGSLENFMTRHANLKFDMAGLAHPLRPSISLALPEGTSAKFAEVSIQVIIDHANKTS